MELNATVGADRKMTRWAEAVAPHVSTGRCIVYVDFVGDVVPLALRLSEEFGIPTGRFYGCGRGAKYLEGWNHSGDGGYH